MVDAKTRKRNIAVFIASPGDLGPERQQFRETIEALNSGFGDGAGILFEPLGWENVLSSVGARAQGVINQDIDRCDVFILALNRRWGQVAPDSEYSSYTEEEFHRALTRFETCSAPAIFVFFKRVDPESEGDPGPQLTKVMAFRQSLEDTRKVLYRSFDDIESFGSEVDKHLRAFARDELPDSVVTTELSLLPLNALKAIQDAKTVAEAAQEKAQQSQEEVDIVSTRADALALQLAEDAAEAALDGKVEKARQRFAKAIVGTANLDVLYHAYQFYYRTGDLNSAVEVGERWLAATKSDSLSRAGAYGNLGNVYRIRGELDQAVAMYEKALALDTKFGRKEGMANDYNNLGRVHQTRGELDQAIAMYEKSVALNAEMGCKDGIAGAYRNLGITYGEHGELDQAALMHEKALELDTELNCEEGMASDYGNLGIVHRKRGELDQAFSMYEKSLALNTKLGRKEGMANGYGNLGNVLGERGKPDQAIEMYKEGLALSTELGHKESMARLYNNIGSIHDECGELDQAVEMYENALALNTELGRKEGMAHQLGNLGVVHQRRGALDQAQESWAQSAKLFAQIGSPIEATVLGWINNPDSVLEKK